MATASDIRRRVRDYVYSNQVQERPFIHQLNGGVTATTNPLVVDDALHFTPGDIVEFWDDGEQAYVLSTNDVDPDTLIVIRGWNGTTASSHLDNAVIVKNPRFSQRQMDEAIEGTIQQLESLGVHTWGTATITPVPHLETYNLVPTDIVGEVGVVSVYHEDLVSQASHPLPFKFQRYSTTLSPTGYALRLWDHGWNNAGDDLYYIYGKKISTTADLLPRQEELVVLGAVGLLLGGTMAPRTHDPGKLTDQGVQPGQGGRDARWFQAEFYVRSRAEQALLKAEAEQYPQSRTTARARRWAW